MLQPLLDLDAVPFVAFGDQLLPYFEDTGTVVFFPSSEYVLSLTIIRSKSPERSAQTDVIQRTAEKSWYISAARTRVPRFGTRRRCFHLLPFAMVQKQNDPAYRSFSCRFSRLGIAQAKLGSALGLSKTLIYRIVYFVLRNLTQQKRPFEKDLLSGKRDSNSRPQPWQGCALPTELFPQNTLAKPIRFGTANIGVKNNIPKFLMKKYEKPQTTGLQT